MLDKILEEIESALKENVEDIEDGSGTHHFAIDSFTANFLVKDIIRKHNDDDNGERRALDLNGLLEDVEQLERIQFSSYTEPLISLKDVKEMILRHMNDGWIPCSEREPEVDADIEEIVEEDECPEYNVTIKGATEATTLKYHPDGTWFDANGYVYDVIAWRPLPGAYRPEKGVGK